MSDPLLATLKVAGSGLEAQSTRLRIVSENIANARTTGDTPGADPYRRKTVEVKKLGVDFADFIEEYDPGNPAADERGIVKMPNVNILVEMADMRESNRTYEANLQTIKQTRDMISQTIALLKASQ
jgi:flagellar basal-body rod protein FlgC